MDNQQISSSIAIGDVNELVDVVAYDDEWLSFVVFILGRAHRQSTGDARAGNESVIVLVMMIVAWIVDMRKGHWW